MLSDGVEFPRRKWQEDLDGRMVEGCYGVEFERNGHVAQDFDSRACMRP